MEDEIKLNLVFLTENLTNLTMVLNYLIQLDIISKTEREYIEAESTPTEKNTKLFSTIEKKDWEQIRERFLEILLKTNNDVCAQGIQNSNERIRELFPLQTKTTLFHPKINQKWWPEKKLLVKSLLKRKFGENILIIELQERITRDENRMVVICESLAATKYSGMGGVGKTLTAKWYAHTYEQEYDHIVWIDCGEGSLLTSFEGLARDLKVEHQGQLTLKEIATKSFNELKNFRCLCIYDNAENYKGEEGIINVLPKDLENFYCIITSRSREWGTETGFGKISALELDIFSDEESLDFLKTNLNESIKRTDLQLKELCRLMGNLPLALQLAVAALNDKRIELQNYIEKTSSMDLGNICNTEFDDYEKTINKNIKVSLDLILKQKNGKMAYKILMIFGYIRPDDVQSLFLSKVLNVDPSGLKKAIDLLEKYALITKTGKVLEFPHKDGIMNKLLRRNKSKMEMSLLSIHRLLQQVIRYNGRESENETLTKILGCAGFIDYKLIPFTKYAGEKLQKTFPKVKAELFDQTQLRKMIGEGRMEEAVQLAKFINGEVCTQTSKFNYAVCLNKNGQVEECVDILKELYLGKGREAGDKGMIKVLGRMLKYLATIDNIKTDVDFELMDLKGNPTGNEIGNILFFIFLDIGKYDKVLLIAEEIVDESHIIKILRTMLRQRRFKESVQLAKIIAEELKSQTPKFNYAICLAKDGQEKECVDILKELENEEMRETRECSKESLEMRILGLKEELTRNLVNMHLMVIQCSMELKKKSKEKKDAKQRFHVIYSTDSLGTLIRLVHSDLIKSNYSLFSRSSTIRLELGGESSKIELKRCSLDLSSFERLSPEELQLFNVSFNRNGREVEEANLNEFCDFHKINKLTLGGDKMSIELSDEISMEYLDLTGVKVLNWKEARWNIQRLELMSIPFVEKTEMKVKEMDFRGSSLDICCLPPTIEKLELYRAEVVCNEPIDLPNLKYLTLQRMSDSSFLSSFRSANLTHIHFFWVEKVNVDQIPKNVTHIKITKQYSSGTIVVGGVRRVDKLHLWGFSFKEVGELLGHFQTDELVVWDEFTPKELIELTKKEIKRIAVGEIDWKEEDLSVLSSHVDRKADYYLWEGGRGRGMEEKEFWELMKLY